MFISRAIASMPIPFLWLELLLLYVQINTEIPGVDKLSHWRVTENLDFANLGEDVLSAVLLVPL